MKKKFKTVEEYIQSYPDEIQDRLQSVRQAIRKAAPKSEEVISYQIPAFRAEWNVGLVCSI